MSTQAVSELRLRMIEDMKARELDKRITSSRLHGEDRSFIAWVYTLAYLGGKPVTLSCNLYSLSVYAIGLPGIP